MSYTKLLSVLFVLILAVVCWSAPPKAGRDMGNPPTGLDSELPPLQLRQSRTRPVIQQPPINYNYNYTPRRWR